MDSQFPARRRNRLHNFDYSSVGWYYVTVCTHNNANYFGRVENYIEMKLSDIGKIVDSNWRKIPEHFKNTDVGEYKIMPNHVHGIIKIQRPLNTFINNVRNRHACSVQLKNKQPQYALLPIVIGSFKSASTKLIRKINPNFKWHKSYHDRIIRSDAELKSILGSVHQ